MDWYERPPRARVGPANRVVSALARTAVLLASLACGAARHPVDTAPVSSAPTDDSTAAVPPRATVRVENQRYLNVDVYAVYEGQRVRLGTVTGESTQVFALPTAYVDPAKSIRILALPVGGNAVPISEEVHVYPGDELNVVIAPY